MSDARFTVLDASNESNKIDAVGTAAGFPVAAIVDEEMGGIYMYVAADAGGEVSPETVCDWLNYGAVPYGCTGARHPDGAITHDDETCPVHEEG